MSTQQWRPPVPDDQVISEAYAERTMSSIVEWRDIPGTDSSVGLDANGDVLVTACGRRTPDDPDMVEQEAAGAESQDVAADDEYA